jgi:hypothetical protein
MNTTPGTNARGLWSRILIMAGSIGMLVGALDLMEGSLVILPGSGLVALGTVLGRSERRWIVYRVGVFLLIALGVGAMWGMTQVGGIGGNSGHSNWWGLLVLPYLIGWSMGIWGPGSPRWLLVLGIVVGLWFQVIVAMILAPPVPRAATLGPAVFVISALGVLTIGGCISRLRERIAERK